MLIKATPTGRQFGDKREPTASTVTVAGVKLIVHEYDTWDGPVPDSDPDQSKPQYWRMTEIEQPKVNWP
jgi:hypothetical protein